MPPTPSSGSHPFVAAVAAVVVREGRLLALRRSPHKDAGPGLWETLSGRIEPDEEPLAAVRREIIEETGLEVEVEPRPLTAYAARRLELPMVVIVYRARYLAPETGARLAP
jgi:8-oxo-dGTP pyrophosphatase MutT (NUDIX family)